MADPESVARFAALGWASQETPRGSHEFSAWPTSPHLARPRPPDESNRTDSRVTVVGSHLVRDEFETRVFVTIELSGNGPVYEVLDVLLIASGHTWVVSNIELAR